MSEHCPGCRNSKRETYSEYLERITNAAGFEDGERDEEYDGDELRKDGVVNERER